jgi:hypothetical protein
MTPLDYSALLRSARSPVFGRDVIATSHPLASQAGMSMLMHGGNAVNAAVAAAMALTVVEPTGCGIGSDAFAIPSPCCMGQRLGAALRHRRDRQRKLAVQEPRLTRSRSPAAPIIRSGSAIKGVPFGRRSGVPLARRLTARRRSVGRKWVRGIGDAPAGGEP